MTSTTAPLPPSRRPIMLTEALQRIGEPYLHVDRNKVVAVIETHSPDRNAPFSPWHVVRINVEYDRSCLVAYRVSNSIVQVQFQRIRSAPANRGHPHSSPTSPTTAPTEPPRYQLPHRPNIGRLLCALPQPSPDPRWRIRRDRICGFTGRLLRFYLMNQHPPPPR